MKKITILLGIMMLLMVSIALAEDPSTDYWRFNTTLMQYDTVYSSGVQSTTKGLFFTDDGAEFFTVDRFYNQLRRFNMTTPWNISTASLVSSVAIGGTSSYSTGVHLSSDYTKVYVTSGSGDEINEYHLTTPLDITTFAHNQTLNMPYTPDDLHFNNEGSKMYVLNSDSSGNDIFEYDLSTPWDINTSILNQSRSIAIDTGQSNAHQGLAFSPEGYYMFVNRETRIWSWILSNPWDISTATFQGRTDFSSIPGADQAYSVFVKNEGDRIYMTDNDGIVMQYIIPAPNWTCTGYEECIKPMTNASCNETTDLNNRGYPYTLDYSEFTPFECIYPEGGSKTRYLVDSEGTIVGVSQNGQITLLEETTKKDSTPLLSIGGGSSFDAKTWFNNIWSSITGWFVK